MKELITTDSTIHIYDLQEQLVDIDSTVDYIICQADALDSIYENNLIAKGFRFHDRVLYMEINLRKTVDLISLNFMQDMHVVCDNEFSDNIYELAYKAYTADRRFHLEPIFNQAKAIPVMKAYIDVCRDAKMKIYKVLHGAELLGYTIVDENVDKNSIYFENVLGVTAPGIKGKMCAHMLYTAMLRGEASDFKKYIGRVSASNAVSINLHYQLGAKTSRIYDEFIYSSKQI